MTEAERAGLTGTVIQTFSGGDEVDYIYDSSTTGDLTLTANRLSEGLTVFCTDSSKLYVYNGSDWKLMTLE